jgi:hypothetical protein
LIFVKKPEVPEALTHLPLTHDNSNPFDAVACKPFGEQPDPTFAFPFIYKNSPALSLPSASIPLE